MAPFVWSGARTNRALATLHARPAPRVPARLACQAAEWRQAKRVLGQRRNGSDAVLGLRAQLVPEVSVARDWAKSE